MKLKATEIPFSVFKKGDTSESVYPYLRCEKNGDKEMFCVSPLHGRSFVVGKTKDDRYIVSKGNGLSYTQYALLNTQEFGDDTWGLLLKEDAERDFLLGNEIASFGIKTNHMEYVIELEKEIVLYNGKIRKPVLLQYDVECPYRICDASFMTKGQIQTELDKWEKMNDKGYAEYHLIAANILIRNLRILHNHEILHNAIHEQNYTWALELLDFELACSPAYPYIREDYQRHAKSLFPREIIQTYVIINYIAYALNENIRYSVVDNLFLEYGFDLKDFSI